MSQTKPPPWRHSTAGQLFWRLFSAGLPRSARLPWKYAKLTTSTTYWGQGYKEDCYTANFIGRGLDTSCRTMSQPRCWPTQLYIPSPMTCKRQESPAYQSQDSSPPVELTWHKNMSPYPRLQRRCMLPWPPSQQQGTGRSKKLQTCWL